MATKPAYKSVFSGQTAGYAGLKTVKGKGIAAIPKNALYRTYGPGGDMTISGSHPVNQRWEYASPQDYRGYAKGVTAQQTAGGGSAAAPPVAAPTGGSAVASALGGSGGGGTGGLASNPFLTDPGYLSALAAEQTGSQQADSALRAAQEQAIVKFGDPSLAQAAGLNVNPLTAQAAQANTAAGFSTVAGLQRTRDDNQTNLLDTLAAHGMLDSGQTGYATGRNQQAYGQDLYNATQTALTGLNTAASTDVTTKQGLHSDVTKALGTAYDTMVSTPSLWGAANVGGQNAALNANATAPPVTSALSPNNRAGALGVKAPAPPRLATANAYAAGTARGGRAG